MRCDNHQCEKCFPIPRPKMTWKCRLGFHDLHQSKRGISLRICLRCKYEFLPAGDEYP